MLRIFLGSDHAGITLKLAIRDYLEKSGKYQIIDVGTDKKQSCHYPQFAKNMAQKIKPEDRGILFCGSGIGIGIAANKCRLPCSTAYDEYTAAEVGRHFKVMAIGQRVVSENIAKLMVEQFLRTSSGKKEQEK